MRKRRFYSIGKNIAITLLVGLYLVQFYLAVMSTKVENLPKVMGWGEVIFLSGSMSPAIETGSLGFVHQQSSYQEGDIVTYLRDHSLITHRIMEIQEDEKIIVKGDANNTADKPITKDMIEGKVVLSIPYAGTFLKEMKSPIGMAGIAGIAVLIALWPEKDEEEQDEDNQHV